MVLGRRPRAVETGTQTGPPPLPGKEKERETTVISFQRQTASTRTL